jgi:hypothetical protein
MRRALATVALVLLPLVAAACGGSKSSAPASVHGSSARAAVQNAVEKSAQVGGQRVSMQGRLSVAGHTIPMTVSGVFDSTSHEGSAHATVAFGGITAGLDEILDGTVVYMRSPLLASTLPNGKSWFKLDLQELGARRGIDFSALLTQDPTRTLDQLKGLRDVRRIGTATIGGVETTHYRARLDIAKVAQGAKIEALTKARYGPYDVWVGDDDGYVHRVRFSVSYAEANANPAFMTMTIDYSDFGTSAGIVVPPASQVFDATNVSLKGLGA